MITRELALAQLNAWVSDPGLIAHCLGVEKVMAGLAKLRGLSSEHQIKWGIAGLVHDADWERWPKQHPKAIVGWLNEQGEYEIADAVAGHGVTWGIPHTTEMSKALVASDELTGFVLAYARVRPDGLDTLTGAGVAKKLKTPSFAAGIDRQEVIGGSRILGVTVEQHADTIIGLLRKETDGPPA